MAVIQHQHILINENEINLLQKNTDFNEVILIPIQKPDKEIIAKIGEIKVTEENKIPLIFFFSMFINKNHLKFRS